MQNLIIDTVTDTETAKLHWNEQIIIDKIIVPRTWKL